MYVPGASTPEFFQLRLGFVTSTSCGRAEGANSLHCAAGYELGCHVERSETSLLLPYGCLDNDLRFFASFRMTFMRLGNAYADAPRFP